MPQRIILTGTPVSSVRGLKEMKDPKRRNIRVYAFEMEEEGMGSTPKSLPKSSKVQFTVFCNELQMKKAEIFGFGRINDRLRIIGEIVLDVPLEYCPGEIGVMALTIEVLPPRKSKKFGDYTIAKEPVDVDIDTIVINDYMANLPITQNKRTQTRNYTRKHMTIERPLVVIRKNNHLVEGLAEYLAAMEFEVKTVPVKYIGKPEEDLTPEQILEKKES